MNSVRQVYKVFYFSFDVNCVCALLSSQARLAMPFLGEFSALLSQEHLRFFRSTSAYQLAFYGRFLIIYLHQRKNDQWISESDSGFRNRLEIIFQEKIYYKTTKSALLAVQAVVNISSYCRTLIHWLLQKELKWSRL